MTTAIGSKRVQRMPEEAVTVGRTRSRRSKRQYFSLNGATIVTIAALTLSAIGILYLMQTSHVAGLGYEIAHLQQRQDQLALENSRLGYEIGRHESLDTVQQVAVQQLGMIKLQNYEFIKVRLPVEGSLPPPTPETVRQPSLWARAIDALFGVGYANAPTLASSATLENGPGEEAP